MYLETPYRPEVHHKPWNPDLGTLILKENVQVDVISFRSFVLTGTVVQCVTDLSNMLVERSLDFSIVYSRIVWLCYWCTLSINPCLMDLNLGLSYWLIDTQWNPSIHHRDTENKKLDILFYNNLGWSLPTKIPIFHESCHGVWIMNDKGDCCNVLVIVP